jgi:PAS domain S-box-containing protein
VTAFAALRTHDEPVRYDRQLIDAAIAVNEAPTLDAALRAISETACAVTGCAYASVVIWDDELERGVLRGVAGAPEDFVGTELGPGSNASYQAVLTGRPVFRTGPVGGIPPDFDEAVIATHACRIGVPIRLEGAPRMTLHVAWIELISETEAEAAIEVLATLGRLTSVAFRAEEERRLQRERVRLDAILDAVDHGVIVKSGGEMTANRHARALLGLPDGRMLPAAAWSIRGLDGAPVPQEELAWEIARRTGSPAPFRLRVTTLDGRELVVEGSVAPLPGEDANVTLFRDVTEQHEHARFTQEFLDQLFEALPTGISVLDPVTHEVLRVNRAFGELVGIDPADAVGLRPPFPWHDVAPPIPVEEWGKTEVERVEAVYRHADGRPVPVEVRPFGLRDVGESHGANILLVTDLSDRRRFEQQLLQSGKLATIGELAAGVAHEINNPLFAILGLVEFLLMDAEPGTKAYQRLSLIQETGLEIKEIVRALLDFARASSDEFEPVELADVVRQTAELVRRTSAVKAVELVERYDDEPTPIVGSAGQLKQIFVNLLSNAQQATAQGGTVTVEVRREGGEAVAVVSDTGPGIAPEHVERIFEPFFTTKRDRGGTGLGLPVSLGIAHSHGGSLALDAEAAGGASFVLRLPLRKD